MKKNIILIMVILIFCMSCAVPDFYFYHWTDIDYENLDLSSIKKVKDIQKWVFKNINYVEYEGVENKIRHPRVVLKNGYGDCTDMAFISLILAKKIFNKRGVFVSSATTNDGFHDWAQIGSVQLFKKLKTGRIIYNRYTYHYDEIEYYFRFIY